MSTLNLIYFLSAYPGAGKTHAILQAVLSLFREVYPSHIIVVAFPTVVLLEQFLNDILKHSTKHADKIRIVRAPNDEEKYVQARKHLEHKEIIEQLNAEIIRETTTKQFELHMVGQRGDDYQAGIEMIPNGHVILTTHAAIINLPSNFKGQQRVHLMFDEARDCLQLESNKSVRIPDAVYQELRNRYIVANRQPVVDDECKPTGNFFELWTWKSSEPAPSEDRLRSIWESATKLKWTAARSKPLYEFLQHVANGRLEAWIAFNSSSEEDGEMVFTFNTLLSPAHLFYGFKKVTICSAFFESSQMFHILKHRQSLGFDGYTKEGWIKWNLATPYQDRVELLDANVNGAMLDPERVRVIRQGIESRCTLVPLFSDFPGSDDDERPSHFSLSKGHLKDGIVVSPGDYSALHTEYHAHDSKLRWQTRYERWHALDENKKRDPHDLLPVPKLKPFLEYARALQHTESAFCLIIRKHAKPLKYRPLLFAAMRACKVYDAWNASLPAVHRCKKPLLLTTNVMYDAKSKRTYDEEFGITRTLGKLITYVPPMQQGINGFMEYQAAAFLATLKLTPSQAALMKHIAPMYDSGLDRTIDACIQFLLRVNVRQAFDDDGKPQTRPCLFIVTDRELAEGVARQLGSARDGQKAIKITIADPAEIVEGWKPATVLTFVPDAKLSKRDTERLEKERARRDSASPATKAAKARYAHSFGNLTSEYERLKKRRTRLNSEFLKEPETKSHLKEEISYLSRQIEKLRLLRKGAN
ncbi:hypothetical protein P3T42_000002 [Paraburkholderia sp. GAS38]|uniref:hypothetical protein n=1 Tax=Paraburkholderia sp. GAS38 TaxID=3035133 RepID=UPI003D1EEAA8